MKWPGALEPPTVTEILEASVPSRLAVDGLSSPRPAHHALILAAHSWEHSPLRVVRDLLDVALLAAEADERELAATAAAWNLEKVWDTTRRAIDSLFYGRRESVPLRTWARHLGAVRERTVFESHLSHWMSPFWELPAWRALTSMPAVLRDEINPEEDERWRDKLGRTVTAVRHSGMPRSRHDATMAPDDRASG